MDTCMVSYCSEPAREGFSLCSAHQRQVTRRGHTSPVIKRQSPRERVFEAALALRKADSENDAEFRLLRRRFWDAVRDLMATWKRPGTPGRRIHKSVADE